jgi:hypothetical protein
MYFAQEYVSLDRAVLLSAGIALTIIALRAATLMGKESGRAQEPSVTVLVWAHSQITHFGRRADTLSPGGGCWHGFPGRVRFISRVARGG